MIILYLPEDGEEHRWDLKSVRISSMEAETVERNTGLEWEQAKSKVVNGSMLALRAVVFVLLKREQPTLRYNAFDPAASELGYEFDAEELATIRAEIEKNPELDEDERAALLAQLEESTTTGGAEPDMETVPKDSGAGASLTAA